MPSPRGVVGAAAGGVVVGVAGGGVPAAVALAAGIVAAIASMRAYSALTLARLASFS